MHRSPRPLLLRSILLALPTSILLTTIAVAHHSPAVFDRSREATIDGTVTEFRWGNPHSWIHVDVEGDDGTVANWIVEMDPASHLARRGWRSTVLKPGDHVEVVVHPLRNDEKGGQFIEITLPDGKVMTNRSEPQVLAPER